LTQFNLRRGTDFENLKWELVLYS